MVVVTYDGASRLALGEALAPNPAPTASDFHTAWAIRYESLRISSAANLSPHLGQRKCLSVGLDRWILSMVEPLSGELRHLRIHIMCKS